MSFASAHPSLQTALAKKAYSDATPVQAAVLGAPPDRDLLVSAQTGSGKTVAFGLGLASTLLGDQLRFGKAGQPLALAICPTRELAQQVFRELSWLLADTGARVTTCVGGFDPRREAHALAMGVHVVVGTPGRLADHLARGVLSLARLQVVVLDEADEMLDMGFREDIEKLLESAPPERRTFLFSATIPPEIAALAKRFQKDALRIQTQSKTERHADIEYRAVTVVPRERNLAVVNVLRYEDAKGALVFCATRDGVTHLANGLAERGFSVAALSGELSQRERNTALQSLRDGRARVCVATDVAARGLDLPDLGLVIHADLPQNAQTLVHRSGRTGRAGKRGLVVVLVAEPARSYASRMFAQAHVDVSWSPPPSADQILARDQEQLVPEIIALTTDLPLDDRAVARTLLATHEAEALVAALVKLRRDLRPSPEELSEPRPARPQKFDRPPPRGPRDDGPPRRMSRDDAPRRDEGPRDDAPRPEAERERRTFGQRDKGPREPLPAEEGGGRWFKINVGKFKNADPKWIVPLLCRRGDITKKDIGKIQIMQRETRVEIAPAASERFAEAVKRPDAKDKNIHITPI